MEKIQRAATGRRFLALVMTFAGAFVWFFNDSDTALAHDIMTGIGVLVFLLGITHLGIFKSWAGLSAKERKEKLVVIAVVAAILLLGMIIFF